jgi:hypothetical protein
MNYSFDMSNEKPYRELFPEGSQELRIESMELKVSNKGNEMFEISFTCLKTGAMDIFYFLTAAGKRWMLKLLLEAAGEYKKDNNNNYSFDSDNLLGRIVEAEIIHEEESYIDADGTTKKKTKNKIVKFYKTENNFNGNSDGKKMDENLDDEKIPF